MVEKEKQSDICCLRTDRGGEFTSSEFNTYCSLKGIRRQLTAAFSPQQNGVAERKNRTLMNMVRCMLADKEVPKEFWPEAVNWAVHILNRCPTSAMKDMTPEEAWKEEKPSVEHFRIFGCIGHVHIPDEKRKKLDDKSSRCVFLGFSEESKANRMYDPKSKKIVISRDVIFEEGEKWDWGSISKEAVVTNFKWENEENEIEKDVEVDEGDQNRTIDSNVSPTTPVEIASPVQGRRRRQPIWMQDYVSGDGLSDEETEIQLTTEMQQFAMFASEDPNTFEEAVKIQKWKAAMDQEIEAINKNGTWELTELPPGAKKIGVKWVFKTKLNEKGEVEKCKARLVAKGYTQQAGIDYTEIFAPVARWDTIRLILSLAASRVWKVYQLDVKSAFLQGEINEEVFVEQPKGYEVEGAERKVYKLLKALYGLKQAPRAWFSKIESFFINEGFERCLSDHTLFTKKSKDGDILIISLYVDDLIVTGNNEQLIEDFKNSMKKEFDMSDLGCMKYFLGVEVVQSAAGIFISQRKYANEILERFGMNLCKPVKSPIVPGSRLVKDEEGTKVNSTNYKQMIGSLMYLTVTRPDLCYVVSLLARFMEAPTLLHEMAVKRVCRYLKGTTELGILYKREGEETLLAYSDSDYAGDLDDRKSTSGYVFNVNSAAVAWSSKKQPVVSLSTTEAEFIAAAACACQSVWMQRVLGNLGKKKCKCVIYCDNSSTIKLSKNPVMHGRSKHIDVRFHFLRDLVTDGIVELVHCGSKEQLADIMTKPLKLEQFLKMREQLGLCSVQEIN